MSAAEPRPPIPLQRAAGRAAVTVQPDETGRTQICRLNLAGCLKLRFPRLFDRALEGVIINTAGGLTGGDRVALEAGVASGAELVLSTQAAERVYRSSGGDAEARTHLVAAPGATLFFLPQETILFDGGRLRRRLDVEVASSTRLLVCETVILGRTLMGETVRGGSFSDAWRIRRDGRLVFAEEARLAGDIDVLASRPAGLGGGRAFATILMQDAEAESMLKPAREAIGAGGGASLVEGLLVARLVAPTGFALRKRLVPLLAALARRPLPRVWSL